MDGEEQDNSKDTANSKKKTKIEESETEKQVHEDLTMAQVKENYYVETPMTEMDGSFAMYETRVGKEMEARGITREQAIIEVKRKLAKKGISVINTADMTKDAEDAVEEKEEDAVEEKEEEDKDKKKAKSADMESLRKENEQLKKDLIEAKKTNDEMKTDFRETMDFVEKIKKERDAELEVKRQEKIKQIISDFVGVTEEELKEDTMKELLRTEKRLTMALKKEKKEEEVSTEDMQDSLDLITAKSKELDERYNCKV